LTRALRSAFVANDRESGAIKLACFDALAIRLASEDAVAYEARAEAIVFILRLHAPRFV
jgi:hypothetical protein